MNFNPPPSFHLMGFIPLSEQDLLIEVNGLMVFLSRYFDGVPTKIIWEFSECLRFGFRLGYSADIVSLFDFDGF